MPLLRFMAKIVDEPKNVAIEILKKLIAEQVSVYRRTNVVKSELFSEKLQRTLPRITVNEKSRV